MVNPEDTDKYKRFEDVVARIGKPPEKNVIDLEKDESPKPDTSDTPSDTVSPDPRD